jgi:hypothetical protein
MNDELTIDALTTKIATVKADLVNKSGRQFEVLSQYLEYLEDELRIKKNELSSLQKSK